jgi:hypothetical protein
VTAPETFAEGEFNRFYLRAICRAAIRGADQGMYRRRCSHEDRGAEWLPAALFLPTPPTRAEDARNDERDTPRPRRCRPRLPVK